jgi:hypothetical protein
MNSKTLSLFLIGNREAILRAASCPNAIWVGLIFVFAAGIAREYDGEDLLHEPWHLLIPLAASVVSSAILFLLVRLFAWIHGAVQPDLVSGYRVFLALYWLTAPLALLYALPVERWLSAGDAAQANLGLLALVAIWRVVLMTRIISVIYTAPFGSALAIVLFFADTVMLIALHFMPVPVLMVMGGVRLSPAESVIQGTSLLATVLGMLSWPVWLATVIGVALYRQSWQYAPVSSADHRVSTDMWGIAIVSLCALLPALPFTQREQGLRHQVEAEFNAGNTSAALQLMSKHTRENFPPHWDPPPRIAYLRPRPDITTVLEQVTTTTVAPWVLDSYAEKYANWLSGDSYFYWRELNSSEFERQLAIIEKLPNQRSILEYNQDALRYELDKVSEPLKTRLERILSEAGIPLNREQKSESQAVSDAPIETPAQN